MRALAFTLMSLLCSLALAGATVYRWTDENGVVHYSDQPHANAAKMHVNPAPADPAPADGAAAQNGAPPAPYRGCAIVQPQDDQAYANVESLTVVVQTD